VYKSAVLYWWIVQGHSTKVVFTVCCEAVEKFLLPHLLHL